jgi:broad specificity phosphatase PhoE
VHQHQPHPKPPLKVNPNLREQHFGIAEGHPWVPDAPKDVPIETLFEEKIFPVRHGRDGKFPEGESLDDLAFRSEVAIRECVLTHLPHSPVPEDQDSGVHVALASHGLCIGEMVSALIRLDPEADQEKTYFGLKNTAWTRVDIRVRVSIYRVSCC